jgi:MoaA/NifB/PqqE/SkfB family radical SAM enzyme
MKKIDWDSFSDDKEAIHYLRGLKRYRNSSFRSAVCRARFFLTLLYCRLFKIIKPIFIVLVTNNSCNLKCSYCYGAYGHRDGYEEFSTRQLLKTIDELKVLGTRLLTLHGGESLLRKDMGEIINYAKHQGFYISFNTNGYLVPKRIDDIREVDTVCISLDGREENNDKNRGEGSYKKIVAAIDVILDNSIPLVLHATLTKATMGDMEWLAEFARDKKCRLQYSILYNTGELDEECVMDDTETRKTLQKIYDLKKQGYPVYYSNNVLKAAINWPGDFKRSYFTDHDKEYLGDKNLIPCFHGSYKYQIDADGRVVTCWAHNNPDAPNIKELGISGAIQKCHDDNICRNCAFLANNEHNALMSLGLKNIWSVLLIQLYDAIKINKN